MKKLIFISHRTTDKEIAEMLLEFLVTVGIPRDYIKCSSLPGNDVQQRISREVRAWIMDSVVNIAILSRDYYQSAYCLNEAGILWYLEDTPAILIAMPEINHESMAGFLNSDYILRRLDSDTDIAEIYETVREALRANSVKSPVIAVEIIKLKERYKAICDKRSLASKSLHSDNSEGVGNDAELLRSKEDISEDGYHEIYDRYGNIVEKGQYKNGTLIDGISFNIILKISKERMGVEDREPTEEEAADFDGYDYDAWKEKLLEEPVPKEHIKDELWKYNELQRYDAPLILLFTHQYIKRLGVEYFYVVDKKVRLEGNTIKSTFTNFRTLESFMAENDPDGLEYLKTGRWGLQEADSAEIEEDS